MLFSYTAFGADGAIDEGTKEAPTKEALAHELSSMGKTPVHIEEVKNRKLNLNVVIFSHVPTSEKIAFAKNIGSMLKAGLPLSRALSVIERETKNATLKKNISGIIDDIGKGGSFAEAVGKRGKIFPKLFVAMVRVGEESGSLAESLSAAAFQMSKSDSVVRKVRDAMIYPAIIICIMIAIFFLIMVYVMPTLVATFTQFNVALPLPTRILVAISNILNTHLFAIILSGCVLVLILFFALRTARGQRVRDWVLLRLPFIKNVVADSNCARVSRTAGSLLSAGVDMIEALSITKDVAGNLYFKDVLSEAITRIQKGEPLSSVLRDHENIYPVYIGETVAVGEETGNLAQALGSAADYYEAEVEEKTKNISVVIEPAIMIVVGVAVGFFAISVISPIYSLVNAI